MIIAIDGTAASGKGTLGRNLAQSLGLAYLDTGQLYRAVGVAADARDIDIDAAPASDIADIAAELDLSQPFGDNLRTARAAELASKVAAIPAVRAALLDKQRQFALNPPSGSGAILDGRDIGSVILPDADKKFFVDAAADIRAQRRFTELQAAGNECDFSEVLADIIKRDCRDKNRTIAPMTAVPDAFIIDSSDKNAEEVFRVAMDFLEETHR